MNITPLNSIIKPIELMESRLTAEPEAPQEIGQPTFLDVFSNIITEAAETHQQKSQDMIDLMLGDVDDLGEIQANVAKAQIAMDLLVNVKNSVVESYNEIIKMQI